MASFRSFFVCWVTWDPFCPFPETCFEKRDPLPPPFLLSLRIWYKSLSFRLPQIMSSLLLSLLYPLLDSFPLLLVCWIFSESQLLSLCYDFTRKKMSIIKRRGRWRKVQVILTPSFPGYPCLTHGHFIQLPTKNTVVLPLSPKNGYNGWLYECLWKEKGISKRGRSFPSIVTVRPKCPFVLDSIHQEPLSLHDCQDKRSCLLFFPLVISSWLTCSDDVR